MLVSNGLIFDQWMDVGNDMFTSDLHAKHLASGDQLTIFAVVDDEGGTPGNLTVTVEHGDDGHEYARKNASPEINAQALTANGETVLCGYDSGQLPTASHARLRVHRTGTTARCRVRLFVTIRDNDLDWVPPEVHHHHHPPEPPPIDPKKIVQQTKIDIKTHGEGRIGDPNRPPEAS